MAMAAADLTAEPLVPEVLAAPEAEQANPAMADSAAEPLAPVALAFPAGRE